MSGNPKDSAWRSTPQAKRHRKALQLTISEAARKRLDELAGPRGRSAFVEELIMSAAMPKEKPK